MPESIFLKVAQERVLVIHLREFPHLFCCFYYHWHYINHQICCIHFISPIVGKRAILHALS